MHVVLPASGKMTDLLRKITDAMMRGICDKEDQALFGSKAPRSPMMSIEALLGNRVSTDMMTDVEELASNLTALCRQTVEREAQCIAQGLLKLMHANGANPSNGLDFCVIPEASFMFRPEVAKALPPWVLVTAFLNGTGAYVVTPRDALESLSLKTWFPLTGPQSERTK